MKKNIIDFHVRVWNNDVFIHDRYNIDYASMGMMEGFQCNHHEGTEEYEAQKRICAEIAEKFRELGKLLRKDEENSTLSEKS